MSIARAIDRTIGVFAPRWALHRAQARNLYERASQQDFDAYFGTTAGYEAGKSTRFTQGRAGGKASENEIARKQITQLRHMSWECYRNNAHARKICRALECRVIGRGLRPQSQAVLPNGDPHIAFRKSAEVLWKAAANTLDYRGGPGRGGQPFADLTRVALRATILSGEVLYRYRLPRDVELPVGERRFVVPPPLQVQLIRADRLDEFLQSNVENANAVLHGIELNSEDIRVAYWLTSARLMETLARGGVRIPVDEIGHLFFAEDVDQLRGVPWFAPALFKLRDVGDYEFHELQAAAMASCVALGYRRSSGQNEFGLDASSKWDVTDPNGNPITNLQPGMLMDLGATGEIQAFNPQRPNSNAVEFLAHELRAAATAMPGLKGSTLTGDYRRSSFASERAAENEAWPEIEILQDWFSENFTKPIYDRLVTLAVGTGWFDQTEGFSLEDFEARREEYLSASWHGPVTKSINPIDDAEAAAARIRAGLSDPYVEAAGFGHDVETIIEACERFVKRVEASELKEDYSDQVLGIPQQDTAPSGGMDSQGEADDDDEPSTAKIAAA